ncbi:MAG: terminase gpP N-terminus-related DNA-binding protein, partial [Limisphaerales bacterium]
MARTGAAASPKQSRPDHSIITLWNHGWSFRRIARELQLRRETVSKYVHRHEDSKVLA